MTSRSQTHASHTDPAASGGGPLLYLLMVVPLALALAGAWVGSALTVFHGGPVWLAIVGSIACFLVIPLLWELIADPDQQGGRLRDAILRSSVLSTALIVGLLATHPKTTFEALATRGDWFLGGSRSPTAESIRQGLFKLADGLEWLNSWVRERPWQAIDDGDKVDPGQTPVTVATPKPEVLPEPPAQVPPTQPESPSQASPSLAAAAPRWPIGDSGLSWPLPDEVHPKVLALPPEARRSIQTVGAWLKAEVVDPYQRAKALHDFVATHVRYDFVRLAAGTNDTENQAAEVVFRTGLGVCAGYANLLRALGPHAGVEVVRLTGDARNDEAYRDARLGESVTLTGAAHAWNAVRINGRWFLLDATWDAGFGTIAEGYTAEYKTTYLFIPSEAMTLTHLPGASRWQLREAPLSRAEWLRQPLMRPFGLGLGLVARDLAGPVVDMRDPLTFTFDNPAGLRMLAQWEPVGGGRGDFPRCQADAESPVATVTCPGVDSRARVSFFAQREGEEMGKYIGAVIVDD